MTSIYQNFNSGAVNILADQVSLSSENEMKPNTQINYNTQEFQRVLFGNKNPNSFNTKEQSKRGSISKSSNGNFNKSQGKFETPIIRKGKSFQSINLTPNDLFYGVTNENSQATFQKKTSLVNLPNNGSHSVRATSQKKSSSTYQDEIINSGSKSVIIKSNLKTSAHKENKNSYRNYEENLATITHLEVYNEHANFELAEYILLSLILVN